MFVISIKTKLLAFYDLSLFIFKLRHIFYSYMLCNCGSLNVCRCIQQHRNMKFARDWQVSFGFCHHARAESRIKSPTSRIFSVVLPKWPYTKAERSELVTWCIISLNYTWFILLLNRLVRCNFRVRLRNKNRTYCLYYRGQWELLRIIIIIIIVVHNIKIHRIHQNFHVEIYACRPARWLFLHALLYMSLYLRHSPMYWLQNCYEWG
jgi:hypothetical protein